MPSTQWTVTENDSGLSLQAFIAHKIPELSSKKIKRLIDAGKCTLNGRIERFASTHVGKGDRVAFSFEEPVQGPAVLPPISQKRIIYADEAVIAYDKPPGLLSEDPRLLALLKDTVSHPTLLHRLDKNTSGVLLFAAKGTASDSIEKQFRQRGVHKQYLAIIDGIPKGISGMIEMFMGKLSQFEGQALWGEVPEVEGAWSETAWKVLKKGKEATLVVCQPKTGRTHQIRVHMASIGHPILGDTQYGQKFVCTFQPSRMMLHAARVDFEHPLTGKPVTICAELPPDFMQGVEKCIGKGEYEKISDH